MSPAGKTNPRKSRVRATRNAGETRASEALTVAWMLSVVTVLMCEATWVLANLYLGWQPSARGVRLLEQLLLFAAAVIGVASLLLLPLVYRLRRTPPPTGLATFAVIVALAPLAAIIVRCLA